MPAIKDYLKYYWLENYLFGEVSGNFQKDGYLSDEDFFAIVIWKRNASKTKIKMGIKNSGKTIKEITFEISRTVNIEQKLEILTSISGIGISIASAILTVLYPTQFTIADYRAGNSLRNKFDGENIPSKISDSKNYFLYLEVCKKLAEKNNLSLRDFDRAIWGMDFYEGKSGLKDLARSL